jgi:uncharacterized coiled-coil DUF342 family protein
MKAHPDDYEDAITVGVFITRLEETTKKPFKQIVEEGRDAKTQVEDSHRELKALVTQIEERRKELGPLEVYKRIEAEYRESGTTAGEMVGFVSFHKRLKALEFDEMTALSLANELGKRGLTPKQGAAELAEALKEHNTLGSVISDLETQRIRLDKEVRGLEAERDGLHDLLKEARTGAEKMKGMVDGLTGAVQELKSAVEEISKSGPAAAEKIFERAKEQMERAGDEAGEAIEGELGKMSKMFDTSARKVDAAASSVLTDATKAERKMKQTSEEIVGDMDRIGKRGFQVGVQVASLEPISVVYRFISKGQGEKGEVFPIAINFLTKFSSWEEKEGYPKFILDQATKETIQNWKNSV